MKKIVLFLVFGLVFLGGCNAGGGWGKVQVAANASLVKEKTDPQYQRKFSDLLNFSTGLEFYWVDNEQYPSVETGGECLGQNSAILQEIVPKYEAKLKAIPGDFEWCDGGLYYQDFDEGQGYFILFETVQPEEPVDADFRLLCDADLNLMQQADSLTEVLAWVDQEDYVCDAKSDRAFFLFYRGGIPTNETESLNETESVSETEIKTVEQTVDFDYYVDALIEKEYQDYINDEWHDSISKEEFLKELSPELDSENYYGSLHPLYLDGDIIFTLFLRKNDTPIIAMDGRGCGPLCQQTLTFWTYEDGVWTDVSEIFPFLSDEESAAKMQELQAYLETAGVDSDVDFIYDLPQRGTTIQMVNQFNPFHEKEKRPVYEFDWNSGKGFFTAREI